MRILQVFAMLSVEILSKKVKKAVMMETPNQEMDALHNAQLKMTLAVNLVILIHLYLAPCTTLLATYQFSFYTPRKLTIEIKLRFY